MESKTSLLLGDPPFVTMKSYLHLKCVINIEEKTNVHYAIPSMHFIMYEMFFKSKIFVKI